MMLSRSRLAVLLMLTVCGCGTAELPTETAATKPPAAPAKLQPQLLDDAATKAEPDERKPEMLAAATKDAGVAEAQAAEFEPPYPNRENLFLAPKRSTTHGKTSGSVEQTVELLGFANVEQVKVILSVNGLVVPISEGEQQAGIEVIPIQPPAVVLQRDRERWQATLEN